MVDPQRLRDEIELRDAIDRHKARERENTIWAIGLFILVAHALIYWWILYDPSA